MNESAPSPKPRGIQRLLEHFEPLEDPRVERTRLHELPTILVMALCGAVCGADGWDELAWFAQAKASWFCTFLDMPHGVPSADTFRRVLSALKPEKFEACFRSWVGALAQELSGQTVAVDGKAVRGALQRTGRRAGSPLHLVHAWAGEQQLLLGQKSSPGGAPGEVEAVVQLLAMLELQEAVVTVDANGCTARVAQAAVEAGAQYVLALKGNRGQLHEHVQALFEPVHQAAALPQHLSHLLQAHGQPQHGRFEVRSLWALPLEDWPLKQPRWPMLQTAVMVERERMLHSTSLPQGTCSLQRHYYLSSLPPHAPVLAQAIRSHWAVENGLHWCLDVAFNEDRRRIRDQTGATNFALLARLALAMLKRETSRKGGIALKRKRAGWEPSYLLRLLSCATPEI